MVDYSKWDDLSVSSEDQDDKACSAQPHVTHFSQPQSITFGGSSESHQHDTLLGSKQTEPIFPLKCPKKFEKQNQLLKNQPTTSSHDKNSYRFADTTLCVENVTKNGGITDQYAWCQTKTEVVCIYWDVPQYVRGRDVQVRIYTNGNDCVNQHLCKTNNLVDACGQDTVHSLNICIKDKQYLKKCFPYAVLGDDNHFFWEIKKYDKLDLTNCAQDFIKKIPSPPFKALMITVTKSIIIYNAVIWWNCMFAGDPSVDVTRFQERSTDQIKKRKETFQKTWDSAHTAFLESINKNGRNPVILENKQS